MARRSRAYKPRRTPPTTWCRRPCYSPPFPGPRLIWFAGESPGQNGPDLRGLVPSPLQLSGGWARGAAGLLLLKTSPGMSAAPDMDPRTHRTMPYPSGIPRASSPFKLVRAMGFKLSTRPEARFFTLVPRGAPPAATHSMQLTLLTTRHLLRTSRHWSCCWPNRFAVAHEASTSDNSGCTGSAGPGPSRRTRSWRSSRSGLWSSRRTCGA